MHTHIKFCSSTQKENLLNRLSKYKGDGYIRNGSFSSEIIWDSIKFLFPLQSIQSNIWIFRSVMMSAKKFAANKTIIPLTHRKSYLINNDFIEDDSKITGTDIDHAYWRIAFLQGIISQKTYNSGLKINDKSLRLAALSNLSSKKEYYIIKNGVITDETVVLRYDENLSNLYNNIRYTCYQYMIDLVDLLKDDFVCYKVDCIYYRDTDLNRKIVHDYLRSKNMFFKQLVEA